MQIFHFKKVTSLKAIESDRLNVYKRKISSWWSYRRGAMKKHFLCVKTINLARKI